MVTLTSWHVRDTRFGSARRGELGYDEREVDAFLDLVESALAGHGELTADDVRAIRFTEHRNHGYPAAAVDAFIDEVVSTLTNRSENSAFDDTLSPYGAPSPHGTPPTSAPAREQSDSEPVNGVDLTGPLPGEPAFDEAEVDAYLDRITATLAGHDTLEAADVLAAEFSPPQPDHRGYGQAGVEAFLALAASSLDTLARTGHTVATQRTRPLSRRSLSEAVTAHSPTGAQVLADPAAPPQPLGPTEFRAAVPLPEAPAPPRPDQHEDRPDIASRPGARTGRYDKDEVHTFLLRIRATMAGTDDLTGEDVMAATFTPPPSGRPGYTEAEFLALVAAMLGHSDARAERPAPPSDDAAVPLTPKEIHDVHLPRAAPGARGYAEAEVDALLERVEATLAGRDTLTARDVHGVRFHELRAGEGGYDRREVDELLDLIADNLGDQNSDRRPA